MKEITGDLWDFHSYGYWIAITTNPIVKANGELVMGRGIAEQAKKKFPKLPLYLGRMVQVVGNVPIALDICRLVTFPVKHHWAKAADPELIVQSAKRLVEWRHRKGDDIPGALYMPRPGCGNGQLQWADVKPLIEPIFDNRFVVVELP